MGLLASFKTSRVIAAFTNMPIKALINAIKALGPTNIKPNGPATIKNDKDDSKQKKRLPQNMFFQDISVEDETSSTKYSVDFN